MRRAQAQRGPLGLRRDGQQVAVAAFIAAQRADHGIPEAVSCRALGVSESWFYKWRRGDASPRRARRSGSKPRSPGCSPGAGQGRVTADHRALNEAGWRVSKNTVAALMREMGLAARPRGAQGHHPAGEGPRRPRTWSGATSARKRSTRSGMATALRSPRARASSSWTACWTWARAGSSGCPGRASRRRLAAGRWPWRWRCAAARCPASS